MSNPFGHDSPLDRIEHEAAAWVLRCDRGLTPAEQDAFSEWLAADPRHGAQLARHRRHWNRLDTLARWWPEHSEQPNPDLLAPARPRWWRRPPFVAFGMAAAAAVLVLLVDWRSRTRDLAPSRPPAVAGNAPPKASGPRVLEDGTIVELNRDAAISVEYSPAERRVRLEHGEASFAVAKNPARPFIVSAAGIDVRAVGTAFSVRVDAAAVEVLVTEGRVQLNTQPTATVSAPEDGPPALPPPPLVPVLEARQRAVVQRGAATQAPQIATLTPGEIERVLAWQHRLLNFTATPLRNIVAEFNRRNAVQLVVVDQELGSVLISASFRSDNIDGFVGLLEAGFGARAERRGETEIVLRKAHLPPSGPEAARVTAPRNPD